MVQCTSNEHFLSDHQSSQYCVNPFAFNEVAMDLSGDVTQLPVHKKKSGEGDLKKISSGNEMT